MKLPRVLYSCYNLIKKSRAVVKKENDDEALVYFQNILNDAQPKSAEDVILHRFVKGMYNENKHRFMSFIKNTSFECLVLWTESRCIVNVLGLRGLVYAKWNGPETLYSVTKFQPSNEEKETLDQPAEHPLVRAHTGAETPKTPRYRSLKVTKTTTEKADDATLEAPKTPKTPRYKLKVTPDVVDSAAAVPELKRFASAADTKVAWGDMSE